MPKSCIVRMKEGKKLNHAAEIEVGTRYKYYIFRSSRSLLPLCWDDEVGWDGVV